MTERANEDLDLSQNFHGLFEPTSTSPADYAPRNFVKIAVFRNSAVGWVKAAHEFHPSELRDTEELFNMFGGGFYEVWARDEKGKIYTKALHRLDGAPKPMAPKAVGSDGKQVGGEEAGSHSGNGNGQPMGGNGRMAPPGMDPMMWYQSERDREDRQREREDAREQRRLDSERSDRQMQLIATMMTGMVSAMAQMGGNKESSADLMRAAAEIGKMAQPAAVVSTPFGEVLALNEQIEKAAAKRTPATPEEPTSEIINAIASAATPIVQAMVAKSAGLPTMPVTG